MAQRLRTVIIGAAIVAATTDVGRTQDIAGPLPEFDVASVKPNTLDDRPSNNWRLTPGRIDYHNSQVFRLIRVAWRDNSLRVENGPSWIADERYDVVVQFPADTAGPNVALMLRALLINRFKLS